MGWQRLAMVVVLAAGAAHARRIDVDSTNTQGYLAIEAAVDGDTVVLAPGTYRYRVHLTQPSGHIVIRALDPNNWPVFDYSGKFTSQWPGSETDPGPANDMYYRGCWRIQSQAQIEIWGLTIRGCSEDTAAGRLTAAIYVDQGNEVSLHAVDLGTSETLFSGYAQQLQLDYSYLHDATKEGVYVFGGSLSVRHSAIIGTARPLVIEAASTVVEYSWFSALGAYLGWLSPCNFMCGGTGAASTLQQITFLGDVFLTTGQGNTSFLFPSLELDAASYDNTGYTDHFALTATGNSFVNLGPRNLDDLFVANNDIVSSTYALNNNVFYNVNEVVGVTVPATPNVNVSGTNNWAVNGTAIGTLTGTVFGADPGLLDPANHDLRPASTSPLVGVAAMLPAAVSPMEEYFQNDVNVAQSRARLTTLDIGAFEHDTVGPGAGATFPALPPPDDAGSDGGPGDAGAPDAGTGDAGSGDAGSSDAGGRDAGNPHGGSPHPLDVSCACAGGGDSASPWAFAVVGLGALLWARRRRA